jgi:hypothetical protein
MRGSVLIDPRLPPEGAKGSRFSHTSKEKSDDGRHRARD